MGEGWVLALVSNPDLSERRLWLVAPDSDRYLMEEVAGLGEWLNVADWSPNRPYTLQVRSSSPHLVDLTTGESSEVVDVAVMGATFTRPTGRNLVIQALDTGQLQWRSRAGELLGVIAEKAPGVALWSMSWTYDPDGMGLVVGNGDRLVHLTSGGSLIGELALPETVDVPDNAPNPRKWWPDGRVLAACLVDSGRARPSMPCS